MNNEQRFEQSPSSNPNSSFCNLQDGKSIIHVVFAMKLFSSNAIIYDISIHKQSAIQLPMILLTLWMPLEEHILTNDLKVEASYNTLKQLLSIPLSNL